MPCKCAVRNGFRPCGGSADGASASAGPEAPGAPRRGRFGWRARRATPIIPRLPAGDAARTGTLRRWSAAPGP